MRLSFNKNFSFPRNGNSKISPYPHFSFINKKMSKYQRTKGNSWERTVVNYFKNIGFKKVQRHLEFQKMEAEKGVDLDHTGCFSVQCKNMAKFPNPKKIFSQIKDQKGQSKLGIVKVTNQGEYAILQLSDFLKIVKILVNKKIFEP